MTRQLSLLVSWGCTALLILVPLAAVFFLVNSGLFIGLIKTTIDLPIQWQTVSRGQWYAFWVLTTVYLIIGLIGLYFLRRAFTNFAKGEFFNFTNSRDLRRFSIFLLAQTLATPIHFALSSVLLSLNHPAGQKMLSFYFGSAELRAIGVALILWVMSNLLIEAGKLETENRQFI